MKVVFEALIKSITNKSLVSGDKATRIILDFDSTDMLGELNALNELHHADKCVVVAIVDEKK